MLLAHPAVQAPLGFFRKMTVASGRRPWWASILLILFNALNSIFIIVLLLVALINLIVNGAPAASMSVFFFIPYMIAGAFMFASAFCLFTGTAPLAVLFNTVAFIWYFIALGLGVGAFFGTRAVPTADCYQSHGSLSGVDLIICDEEPAFMWLYFAAAIVVAFFTTAGMIVIIVDVGMIIFKIIKLPTIPTRQLLDAVDKARSVIRI